MNELKIGLVVLAAGKSSRMGSPKQLLKINGKTMIKGVVESALESNCFPIVVVVGGYKDLIISELKGVPITIIENPTFDEGISTSLIKGLIGTYMTSKVIDGVIFITSDQPQISSEYINALIHKASQSNNSIIASKFTGGFGIPALFKRDFFENILSLKGDTGAKKVMIDNKDKVDFIFFENGHLDIDTISDYENYLSLN